ncbi:MAG: hypothetical protein WBC07_03695 [Methylotenera sp.]
MKYILSSIVVILFLASLASYAESDMDSGPGSLASSANLYFVIKIPKTLYVRVGTNAPITPKSPSASDSNNATAGALTARVDGNSGAVLFAATTIDHLNEGATTNIKLVKNVDTKIANIETNPITYTASTP